MSSQKRRDFIKTTAATAGGPFLFHIVPPRALGLQGEAPPSDTLNFGHIGIGGRGRKLQSPAGAG